MKPFSEYREGELALASIRVAKHGLKTWFAYKASPTDVRDSGWNFHGPNENDEFCSKPENFLLVPLPSLLVLDPRLREIMDKPMFTCWERYADNGQWFEILDFFSKSDIEPKSAQQGDAPEPGSNVDPASRRHPPRPGDR